MFKGRLKKALRYLGFVAGITVVAIAFLGGLCIPNFPFADACQVSSGASLWVGALLGAITTALFFWMIESKTSEISTTLLGYDQKRAYVAGKKSAELAKGLTNSTQLEETLREFIEVCAGLGMQFDPNLVRTSISADPEAYVELTRTISFRLRHDLHACFRFGQIVTTMTLPGAVIDTWRDALRQFEFLETLIGEDTELHRFLLRIVKLTRKLIKATSPEDRMKLIDEIKREFAYFE